MESLRISAIAHVLFFACLFSPTYGAQPSPTTLDICLHATGQQSLQACSTVISSNPSPQDAANAYYSRAFVKAESGDQEAALADYTMAIRIDPKHDYALHNRAMIYDQRGQYELAIADFTGAIESNPIPGHFYNRARAYAHAGQWRRASDDYTVAHALMINAPDFQAYALAGRCFALAARGINLDDALDDCESATSAHPSDPKFLTIRAFLKLRRGDHAGAAADATTTLARPTAAWKTSQTPILDLEPADALYIRGLAECGLKQIAACKNDISAAVQKNASIQSVYVRYGMATPDVLRPSP